MKQRILSLVLVLAMVLGMLPLTAMAKDLPITKPQTNKSAFVATYEELKEALADPESNYVQLTADIRKDIYPIRVFFPSANGEANYAYYYDPHSSTPKYLGYAYPEEAGPLSFEYEDPRLDVVGEKILDLNGFDIIVDDRSNIYVDEDEEVHPWIKGINRTLIYVSDGATLMINDATRNPGTIHYDAYMVSTTGDSREDLYYHGVTVRDIIKVTNANLIVNGGILEAGRSKEQYISDGILGLESWNNSGVKKAEDMSYYGDAYQQIWGTAIHCDDHSTVVINGGDFYGRGEGIWNNSQDSTVHAYGSNASGYASLDVRRDAVVEGDRFTNLVVNGGVFYAKGGADVFWFDYSEPEHDSDDMGGRVDLYAGSFFLDKLDKIRCPDITFDGNQHVDVVLKGTYGRMNIHDDYFDEVQGRYRLYIDRNGKGAYYDTYPGEGAGTRMLMTPYQYEKASNLTVTHGQVLDNVEKTVIAANPGEPLILTANHETYFDEWDTMEDYELAYTWHLTGTVNGRSINHTLVTTFTDNFIDPFEVLGIYSHFEGTLNVDCQVSEYRYNRPALALSYNMTRVTITSTKAPVSNRTLPGGGMSIETVYPTSGDVTALQWPVTVYVSPTTSVLNTEAYGNTTVQYYTLQYRDLYGDQQSLTSYNGRFDIADLDYQHNEITVLAMTHSNTYGRVLFADTFHLVRHVGYSTSTLSSGFGSWNEDKSVFYPLSTRLTLNSNLFADTYNPEDTADRFTQAQICWFKQSGVDADGNPKWTQVSSNSYSYQVNQTGTYCLGVTSRDGELVYNRPITIVFDKNAGDFGIAQAGMEDVVVNADGMEDDQSFYVYRESGLTGGRFKWKIVDGPAGWTTSGLKQSYGPVTRDNIAFSSFIPVGYDYTRLIPGVYTIQAELYVEGELITASNSISVGVMRKADNCEIYINGQQAELEYTQCLMGNTYQLSFAPADGADYPGIRKVIWSVENLVGSNVATVSSNGLLTLKNPGRVRINVTASNAVGTYTDTIVVDVPVQKVEINESTVEAGKLWKDIWTVDPNAPYTLSFSKTTVGMNESPDLQVEIALKSGYVFPMQQEPEYPNDWYVMQQSVEVVVNRQDEQGGTIRAINLKGALPKKGPFADDKFGITEPQVAELRVQYPFIHDPSAAYFKSAQLSIELPVAEQAYSGVNEDSNIPGLTVSLPEGFQMISSIAKVEDGCQTDMDPDNDGAVYLKGGETFREDQLYRLNVTLVTKTGEKVYFDEGLTVIVNGEPVFFEDSGSPGTLGDNYIRAYYYFYPRIAPPVPAVYVGGVKMTEDTYLPSNGTQIQTTRPEGGYAHYQGDLLVLQYFQFTGGGAETVFGYDSIILTEKPLTLHLEGDNSLTSTGSTTYAIFAQGDLTVNFGIGATLTTDTSKSAMYGYDANISISNGNIVINSGDAGIWTNTPGANGIQIANTTLHITCEWKGIYAEGTGVTVADSLLNIEAGVLGIQSEYENVNISGSTVNITSGSTGICAHYYQGSEDLYEVNVTDSSLVIHSTNREGIFSDHINLTRCELEITSDGDGAQAIEADRGTITITPNEGQILRAAAQKGEAPVDYNPEDNDSYRYLVTVDKALGYTVSGQLSGMDGTTGVWIYLYPQGTPEPAYEVLTDGNGSYLIEDVLPGDYTIVATTYGYEDYTASVTVSGDTVHNITMSKPAADLTVNCIGKISYTVSGQTVTVPHNLACKVGYLVGNDYVAITPVANNDGSYSFTAPDGITEVVLLVKGDVSGDGKINIADTSKVYGHVKGTGILADPIACFAADVSGDGKINVADTSKIYANVKGTTPLAW